ncbi:TPA: hypothetical protein MDF20_000973 [Citrobacter sedlakii]|uniref:hypothetical protein n=1 Tax=Citrobacter sedlakii TaxID=67826 RepID=UPI0038910726|nr:hypothetical protein [Citrobacter sedlakii]
MKHTPGPWYWDSEGLGSKDVLVFGKGYPFEMTSQANMRLIAAAPELLEALQDALHAYDKHGEHPEWDFARAAISKALGEE